MPPYAKVLIVCEGEKTEPNYFQGLRDYYGLNTANVEVCGECDSNPMSLFRYAKQRYREEKDAGDAFDRVYCVFDKDTHADYAQALDAIRRMTPKETYFAITSVPCFEYWLLLHFVPTTRPYNALPGNSACNQVLAELKNNLPEYEKGSDTVFLSLIDLLAFAKANAARGLRVAELNSTDNPSTRVHLLVDFLQNIKTPS